MKQHILFSLAALTLIFSAYCGSALAIGPYTDNGQTIYDNATGLSWQKADDGDLRSWDEALGYCEDLSLASYTNWRLPSIRELISIVDDRVSHSAIDSLFQCRSSPYWSSTSHTIYPDSAWGVHFLYGDDYRSIKTYSYYARCVREEDRFDLSLVFAGQGGGSLNIDPPDTNCTTNCTNRYTRGTSVTLTATAASGSTFIGWSGGGCSGIGFCTVTVDQDLTITANFALKEYTLTYLALYGTISGTNPQTVAHGNNGTAVTAVPIPGYHFVGWSDGSTTNPRTDTNVTSDITVFAVFSNTYTLTYTAGAGGTIEGTNPQFVLHGNDGTAVVADGDEGYIFLDWSDSPFEGVSDGGYRQDTNVTSDIDATAIFGHSLYYYVAGAGGTISGDTYQTVAHGSDGTAVTANAATGYYFDSWSVGSTDNQRTDTNVTWNITVTANFAIYTFTVTPITGANGSMTPSTPQTVAYNNTTAFTADAATANYHVASISGCGINYTNSDNSVTSRTETTEAITSNCTVTANFAVNTEVLQQENSL